MALHEARQRMVDHVYVGQGEVHFVRQAWRHGRVENGTNS